MIPIVKLGSTDLEVSRVGLGTVKFGRNQGVRYPEAFSLPSDREILSLLEIAKELGINLLDTAPAYGSSEERLGKLLRGQREQWILCTKVGERFVEGASYFDFSPAAVKTSIEQSLKKLHTDVLDIVLVHSNGDDEKIIRQDAVFETLSALKKAGLIRAFGMSTKTIEGGLLAVAESDVVMVTYNVAHTAEQPVIAAAKEQQKGIFIKKGLLSGHLGEISGEDPVRTAMRFIFAEPGVTSLILGTLNQGHLRENVEALSDLLVSSA